tara:strand:+ start:259 stop:393 length:135 start_codon:yes stop_codon:yes gene_type:complete
MVITKTKFWKLIREEWKLKHRTNKSTEEVMKLIKDIPQDEDKES